MVAHLALPGAAGKQMFVQQQGSKQYLYIQQASSEGTPFRRNKPAQPNILKHEARLNTAWEGQLEMIGGGLALAEAPDKGWGTANARHELVPAKVTGWAAAHAPSP